MLMERKIRITFRWWNDNKSEIRLDHIDMLEKKAFNIATDKIKEGYKAGEMYAVLEITGSMEHIEYVGYWQYIMKKS